jgi:protein involved in polysaccharide export with SLBB domain
MTTRSDFAAASSSRRARPFSLFRAAAVCASLLALLCAAASLRAQSPTAAPESAARNLLAPSPPTITGPSVSTNAVTAPSGYVLSANDQVAVEVFGEDDLRTNGRLNAEGNLSLPLLGSVHLSGLTLTQATARVTELYARDYLVNPKVNLMLVSYAKRRFTVLGQVNRPGSFEMPEGSPSGIDLLEAVAMAGGYTRIAAPERITVRRHGANGDEMLKVDGKKLARGTGSGNTNFKVLPGDTITVGESIF